MLFYADWLTDLVREKGSETPKTMLFCNIIWTILQLSAITYFFTWVVAFATDDKRTNDCFIGIYQGWKRWKPIRCNYIFLQPATQSLRWWCKDFMKSSACYRVVSYCHLERKFNQWLHQNCCSTCKKLWRCDACQNCSPCKLPFESISQNPTQALLNGSCTVRNVDSEDRKDMQNALGQL